MLPADPVTWAIKQFKDDGLSSRYNRYLRYADGVQDSRLSQPHFDRTFGALYEALTYNRCKSVIDTIADRVKLTGFQVAGGGKAPQQLADIWDENRMDKREGEVNQEALTTGDAYAIIWPHPQTGLPTIQPNDAAWMRVIYDQEWPGLIILAVKMWREEDNYIHLNIYFPDRLEKYITRSTFKNNFPSTATSFEQYQPEGDLMWPLRYDWYVPLRPSIPVIHFANNARTGRYGRSELKDVIPLQDNLNHAMAAFVSSIEQEGFKQKHATGLPTNWAASGVDVGRDRMIIATDPQAKFGNFAAGDLQSLIQAAEQFDVQIARVSKIPVHYLSLSGDFPSGESLKTADTPLVRKAEDIHTAFGNDWEDGANLVLRQAGVSNPPRLQAQYKPAEPQNDKEDAERAVLLKNAGFPFEALLRELGKSDDDIAAIMEIKQRQVEEARALFDAGESPANPEFSQNEEEAA